MKTTTLQSSFVTLTAALSAGVVVTPATARADVDARMDTLRERKAYAIEVEPHFTFGAENVYGNTGFGAGARGSTSATTWR
jgi:hypothetical protein